MSGWERRPPAYRGRAESGHADLQEIRPGRYLSVAHQSGGDTTVVFVHGAGGNKRQFDALRDDIASRGYTLLAWDLHGHGASPRFHPRRPQAIAGPALLDDFEILLNRHATGTTILVGHSFGARLVLAMLARLARAGRLRQVDGALLLAPGGLGRYTRRRLFGPVLSRLPPPLLELTRPLAGRVFRSRAWHPQTDPALIRAQRAQTAGNSLGMIAALLTQAPAIDAAALASLTLPVAILAGEADRLAPLDPIRAIAGGLPDATLDIVRGAGHQIMLERPDACIAALDALRARIVSG